VLHVDTNIGEPTALETGVSTGVSSKYGDEAVDITGLCSALSTRPT